MIQRYVISRPEVYDTRMTRRTGSRKRPSRGWLLLVLAILAVFGAGFLLGRQQPAEAEEPGRQGAVLERAFDPGAWYLTLVNAAQALPADFAPELATVEHGWQVDARIADALNEMLAEARAAGLDPWICSAYRTIEKQTQLFDAKTAEYLSLGYPRQEAERLAATSINYPGTSEHNLGLAVDIVARSYQYLDEQQAATAEAQWLAANCHHYGFILRYPADKQEVTGVIYEPWHFRYVGAEAAELIMREGLCLEEFIERIRGESELVSARLDE